MTTYTKIWSVTVNNWDWDAPRTYNATSREAAKAIADRYPAADRIQYAGCYRSKVAAVLTADDMSEAYRDADAETRAAIDRLYR